MKKYLEDFGWLQCKSDKDKLRTFKILSSKSSDKTYEANNYVLFKGHQ